MEKNKTEIEVTLLNFHGINSHIEILLSYVDARGDKFIYTINQWAKPHRLFYSGEEWLAFAEKKSGEANSKFTFSLQADPIEISIAWFKRRHERANKASLFTENCADAAEWFLEQFAKIPKTHFYSSYVSVNHFMFGLFVPSFLPLGITLPGRVMDNAKFHIKALTNKENIKRYSNTLLNICKAMAIIAVTVSIAGIIAAALFLTGVLATGVMAGTSILALTGSLSFFKAHNLKHQKNLVLEQKAQETDLVNHTIKSKLH